MDKQTNEMPVYQTQPGEANARTHPVPGQLNPASIVDPPMDSKPAK